ncbi:tetratricopeptide repeat protein [Nocardia sp. NPDC005998]|uniref:ATP-binding protein n=1 Tax=Nocardia sp. NPDC005998 TaxID=3156894 RepID=UPI0033B104A1
MSDYHAGDQAQQLNIGRDNTGTINVSTVHVHEAGPEPRSIVTTTLRRDLAAFVGRDTSLRRILQAAGPARASSIFTVDGMAGVGKTALVTRVAHMLAEYFPDGQYFVELHAHTPGQLPAEPADVLAGLLIDRGIDPRNIPDHLAGRRDLWRDLIHGKRILLVLDDARDQEQIEPLLPTGRETLTLVTSRRRLIGLDDAMPVELDVLAPAEAAELFTVLSLRTPAGSDEAAISEIVRLCGYLPLAIALLAGRLAHHPAWTITDSAAEFADAADRLAELDTGHRAVRAAFTMSYDDLPSARQQLFRRLALHPGLDIDSHAAAALADLDITRVRRELNALYADHLVEEPVRGRFRLHDLLREYARTLAATDPAEDNHQALARLFIYYRNAATAADLLLSRVPRAAPDPEDANPNIPMREFRDEQTALAWMRIERSNLLACLDHATVHAPMRMVGLTEALAGLLERDGPLPLARKLHERAVRTARDLGNRNSEATALVHLGRIRWLTGEYAGREESHQQALTCYRELGNRLGEANALNDLAVLRQLTGDFAAAAEFHRQALALYREVGSLRGEAIALDNLGLVSRLNGDRNQAAELRKQALIRYRELGDRIGEANSLLGLGLICGDAGDYSEADDLHRQALVIYRALGARRGEANALVNLGVLCRHRGRYDEAAEFNEHALTRFAAIGDPYGQAEALNERGQLGIETNEFDRARKSFADALQLAIRIHSAVEQARALEGTARCLAENGEFDTAATHLEEAIEIYQRLEMPEAETSAAYLTTLRR